MRFINLVAVVVTATALLASCQDSQNPGTISTTTPNGRTVTITAVNDHSVKVTNCTAADTTVTTQATPGIIQPFNGKIQKTTSATTMTLPSGLEIRLDNTTGAVSFVANGTELLADNAIRTSNGNLSTIALATDSCSSFYGAGERGHALKLNGDTLTVYNKQNYGYSAGEKRISQMNISMPLVLSDQGYALLFDDHAAATLTLTNPLTYASECPSPLSYFFIYGGNESHLADAAIQLAELTGRQELPPFWALGYITSKYGYKTENEARGVIDTLKMYGYPVDGIVLDLYWYGTETDMGRLEWNQTQWPTYRQMLSDLKEKGINTVLISQPYINKKGAVDNYNLLAEKGMLAKDSTGRTHDVTTWVGDAGMFDVSNPDTRQWLANRYKQLTDEGVGGWWCELGEQEVHPETIVHHKGMTARQYHNVYGNVWSKIIYDLYKKSYPDTRLMTLMRGGTTGLQRYSVFPWSTDVSRSWGGLRPQIRIMLNSGLSGLGYMSHDVGGFAVNPELPTDPELYVRWMQLGVFSPILRTHAQQFAEPYHYPEYGPLLRELIKTRYRWLPYNYTLAYENASKGLPLVRPLNFRNHDETLSDIDDQYLWGDDVLVAPMLEKNAKSRTVILPDGIWVDYNNPEISYQGPGKINYKAPLNVLPMLVRAGAFIPQTGYDLENTSGYDASHYTILYYPRGRELITTYTMFEDDRTSTRSLQENKYALLQFHGIVNGRQIKIGMKTTGNYPGMPRQKNITIVFPGIMPDIVSSIEVDGVNITPTAYEHKWLSFTAAVSADKPFEAILELKSGLK